MTPGSGSILGSGFAVWAHGSAPIELARLWTMETAKLVNANIRGVLLLR